MTDEELALRICNAGARAVGFDEFDEWPNLRGAPCIRALAELDEAKKLLIPEMAELRAELAALKARPVACEDPSGVPLKEWIRLRGLGENERRMCESSTSGAYEPAMPRPELVDAVRAGRVVQAAEQAPASQTPALTVKRWAPTGNHCAEVDADGAFVSYCDYFSDTRSLRERLEEAREIISQHQASDEAWKIAQKSWQERADSDRESQTQSIMRLQDRAEKAEREHSELVGRYGACKLRLVDADRELAECRESLVQGEACYQEALREIGRKDEQLIEARKVVSARGLYRGAEIEEHSTQQAKETGLPAIRQAVNELRSKGAYLLADHLCGWANEQDRIPQPEKEGSSHGH